MSGIYNAIKRCILNLISTILIQTCPDILHTQWKENCRMIEDPVQ